MTTKEEFKEKFEDIFANLLAAGHSRTQAAAQALLKAKEICSINSVFHSIEPPKIDDLENMIGQAKQSNDYTSLVHSIGKIFSSTDSLVLVFSSPMKSSSSYKSLGTIVDYENDIIFHSDLDNLEISIKVDEISKLYNTLLSPNIERIRSAISNALESLTTSLYSFPKKISSNHILIISIVVLEHPELSDPRYDILLRYLFHTIDKSSKATKTLFQNWIQNSTYDRYKRYLGILRHHITLRLYQGSVDDARVAVRVLELLHNIRKQYPQIQLSEFYIDALNQDYMSTRDGRSLEFKLWLDDIRSQMQQMAEGLKNNNNNNNNNNDLIRSSFISYPFCLSPAVKSTILEMDAQLQMRLEMNQEMIHALTSGAQYAIPYLILRVRRDFIIPDTLSQMLGFEDSDFKKPLKVVFDGEEGVDAGGVRKEYYQLMMKQMLDPNFGMFKYYEESRKLWFNPDSLENSEEFELVGILLGIAIYNSIIIDLPIPLALYKKLKGEPCTLKDLADLEPTLAKGLQDMLDFEGDVETAYQTPFQVSYEVYGEMRTRNLRTFEDVAYSTVDEGGVTDGYTEVEIVTNDTKNEYVEAYVSWVLDRAMEIQFDAFARGFRKVCGGIAFNLFQPLELELLVCGSPCLDFNELQHGTKYEDGYTAESRVIQDFWRVVLAFDETEKRLFLKFVSGSDRSPIDGLAHMGFVVSKNGADDTRLPSAHTCFNHLLLPEYTTQEVLAAKLKMAITQSEGFGLR